MSDMQTGALSPLPRELEHLCDRFETAWKAALAGGPRPRPEDFVPTNGHRELAGPGHGL
jgi:hypothetical protein